VVSLIRSGGNPAPAPVPWSIMVTLILACRMFWKELSRF
jgi:hypothetical protein